MAITQTKVTTALILKVKTGVQNGKDVFKSLTFKRVKGDAVDGDIFEIAKGIAAILGEPVTSIYKQDVNELANV